MRCSIWLLLFALTLPAYARADEEDAPARDPEADAEGAKDHPDVPRFPGFYLTEGRHVDYEETTLLTGYDREGSSIEKTIGGRYWLMEYAKKARARQPGVNELLRNYENAFKKQGGAKVWSNDVAANYRMRANGGERYAAVHVYGEGDSYRLIIVEPAAVKQQIEISADEMMSALEKDGFVALHGIEFDSGRDVIKPESEGLLGEIAALLQGNAGLKLSIEGHTDNVGNAKANLALSKSRAESVRKWLTGKGIDAKRLISTQLCQHLIRIADNGRATA
jgi:outer membrane protein OmpA-like peptidoglycan-associated protein